MSNVMNADIVRRGGVQVPVAYCFPPRLTLATPWGYAQTPSPTYVKFPQPIGNPHFNHRSHVQGIAMLDAIGGEMAWALESGGACTSHALKLALLGK